MPRWRQITAHRGRVIHVRGVAPGKVKVQDGSNIIASQKPTNIHAASAVQQWSIVMQPVDMHMKLIGDCRGFELAASPSLPPAHA